MNVTKLQGVCRLRRGRENNEQTRGASARRSMRRLFFRAIYGCDSPAPHKRHTSVVCYGCYKSGKITNLIHCVPSHCNFSSIYTSISPPVSIAVLCYPGSLLVLRRLRYLYSGKVFPRTPFFSPNPNSSNSL